LTTVVSLLIGLRYTVTIKFYIKHLSIILVIIIIYIKGVC